MAITVDFYSFAKKKNSTARPYNEVESFECLLKDNTSILHPILILETDRNPTKWNIAFIPMFDRYYWVKWTSLRYGLWEAALDVDPLASWKNTIGASEQYVMRASNAYNDLIPDDMYPGYVVSTGDIVKSNFNSNPFPYPSPGSGGTFVLGVLNPIGSGNGGICYYIITPSNFNILRRYLVGDDGNWTHVTDAGYYLAEEKEKWMPIQFITSCIWYPFEIATTGLTVTTTMKFGFWNIEVGSGFSAHLAGFKSNVTLSTVSCSIPKNPLASDRGKYLNNSPWSRYWLNFKPFGEITIDASLIFGASTLNCNIQVDITSGKSIMSIYTDGNAGNYIMTERADVGVQIMMGQVNQSISTAGWSIFNTLKTADTLGGAIFGAIGAGIESAGWSSQLPQVNTKGSQGSFCEYNFGTPFILAQFMTIPQLNNDHKGRPLRVHRTISSLGGYIQCQDGEIEALGASDEELSSIKSYLEGGFFYE